MTSSKNTPIIIEKKVFKCQKNYHFVVICKMQTFWGMLSQQVSKKHVVIFCIHFIYGRMKVRRELKYF
jgi:hypothetical protein